MTGAGEDVEKSEPSCTSGRDVRWHSPFGKVWQLLKRSNVELPHDPAIPLLGSCSWKRVSAHKPVRDVHGGIIHNNQKVEAAQTPSHWWMGVNKICPVHTTGCYLQAIRRDDAPTHTTARVTLENMVLSEGSQTQMATYCTIPPMGNVQNRHIRRGRKQWLPRAGGRWGLRRGGFLWGVMKCPRIDGGHSCTYVWIY